MNIYFQLINASGPTCKTVQTCEFGGFFSIFFIFDMHRILQNFCKHAIGMLNACTNNVAINIGCSTHVFRHLRQATGRSTT